MNPETNRLEALRFIDDIRGSQLVRPNGEPVPPHWPVFAEGELVELKGYTFKVAHIGESYLVLEPTGPLVVGEKQL